MFDLQYFVNGLAYQRKIDAITAARGRVDSISGSIFNNKLYSVYDWKKEPKESIEELLRDRALQIREKYSYIRLMFSGGYDSYTVLKTFYDNNIHLDEVIVKMTGYQDDNLNSSAGLEYRMLTVPLMKHFEKLMPKTKFKLEHSNNSLFLDNYELFFERSGLHPYLRFPFDVDIFEKPHDNQKSIWLYGDLDPDISIIDNKICAVLWDTSNIELYTNSLTGISFFTHPDFPQLHAKQCHLMKNYFIQNNLLDKINDFNTKREIKNTTSRYHTNLHKLHDMGKAQGAIGGLGMKHKLTYQNLSDDYKKKWRNFFSYKILNSATIFQLQFGVKVFETEI